MSKNISTQLRDEYPDIPWRRIAGFRDVLIHNYMGVDIATVWQIIQDDVSSLMVRIETVLSCALRKDRETLLESPLREAGGLLSYH